MDHTKHWDESIFSRPSTFVCYSVTVCVTKTDITVSFYYSTNWSADTELLKVREGNKMFLMSHLQLLDAVTCSRLTFPGTCSLLLLKSLVVLNCFCLFVSVSLQGHGVCIQCTLIISIVSDLVHS